MSELLGIVGVCPYCQVQRSAIGIVGILMILPNIGHWFMKYISFLIIAFAFVVAANQHFNGWKVVLSASFGISNLMPFVLSACAMAILLAQALLIQHFRTPSNPDQSS